MQQWTTNEKRIYGDDYRSRHYHRIIHCFRMPERENTRTAVLAHTIRAAGAHMISKIAIPVLLLLCFSTPVLAKSTLNIDGNSLYHGYQLYEKGFDYLNVRDEQTAVMYMSFVAGVAGTLSKEKSSVMRA